MLLTILAVVALAVGGVESSADVEALAARSTEQATVVQAQAVPQTQTDLRGGI